MNIIQTSYGSAHKWWYPQLAHDPHHSFNADNINLMMSTASTAGIRFVMLAELNITARRCGNLKLQTINYLGMSCALHMAE